MTPNRFKGSLKLNLPTINFDQLVFVQSMPRGQTNINSRSPSLSKNVTGIISMFKPKLIFLSWTEVKTDEPLKNINMLSFIKAVTQVNIECGKRSSLLLRSNDVSQQQMRPRVSNFAKSIPSASYLVRQPLLAKYPKNGASPKLKMGDQCHSPKFHGRFVTRLKLKYQINTSYSGIEFRHGSLRDFYKSLAPRP